MQHTSNPRSARGFILISLAVVLGIALLLAALFLAKLDADIRSRFAGVRWTLPAQVYAAPTDLYPGQALGIQELKSELNSLGYRMVERLEGPGGYVVRGNSVDVATRAFVFWDGTQAAGKLRIEADGAAITSISDLQTGKDVDLTRLDPVLIGSIYPSRGGEDRSLVRLEDAPKLLIDGLIAVEDRSFYSHWGISLKGIARAFYTNMSSGKLRQGASTITQQLVKNFFLTNERSLKRKIKEIFMSMLLEAHYSKDEILEAYLNEIFMGQDGERAVHGFGLASSFYFNKPVAELRIHEMAMLVAIVKGPSEYSPRRRPELVRERRDLVLGIWAESGLISDTERIKAQALPLGLSGGARGGVARYPDFVELVKRQLKQQYAEDALTDEGLRIFTTLSPRIQQNLEKRIGADLQGLEADRKLKANTLQAAGVVTSVEGGEVQALVGGRVAGYAGFNRALDSRRSIGSLAKPFVYLTALAAPERYSVVTLIDDSPITVKSSGSKPWNPQNYDHRSHGMVALYKALAQSYNLATVRLGMDVTTSAVRKTFAAAGFADTPNLPSMFLGSVDMAPLEVAQVYNTLAAGGFQTPLTAIREVLAKDGTPLKRYPFQVKQTLPEGPVYLTNWAMTKVLQQGTARAAYKVLPESAIFAGKTGTTDDQRDSWFAGFSADHVAVVWLGKDDYKSSGFTGGSGAMPIWARLMRDIKARGLDMTPPADVEMAVIEPETGLLAAEGCTAAPTMSVPFMVGYAPQERVDCLSVEDILGEPSGDPATTPAEPESWLEEIFR